MIGGGGKKREGTEEMRYTGVATQAPPAYPARTPRAQEGDADQSALRDLYSSRAGAALRAHPAPAACACTSSASGGARGRPAAARAPGRPRRPPGPGSAGTAGWRFPPRPGRGNGGCDETKRAGYRGSRTPARRHLYPPPPPRSNSKPCPCIVCGGARRLSSVPLPPSVRVSVYSPGSKLPEYRDGVDACVHPQRSAPGLMHTKNPVNFAQGTNRCCFGSSNLSTLFSESSCTSSSR